MKAVTTLTLLFALVGLASPARALPPWKPKFKELYVDQGPKSLQDAFADNVIGSCKVCHINGEEKTVRNPFGIALDKQIPGDAAQRLAAAGKNSDDAKTAEQAKLDKEFLTALETVLKMPAAAGDGTWGDRIQQGKLPWLPEDAKPNQLPAHEQQQGFVLLFNGKNLNGWKAQNAEHFRVKDGTIFADGTKGRSMLYYVGQGEATNDDKAAFKNFELRLQVYVHAGGNSGIYFRTRWQDAGYPDDYGYEAQIANTHKNPAKTGSIFRIKAVKESPVSDGQWVDYHIIADGPAITIKLNGNVITEFTEPADASDRKPTGELISLQCHDPVPVQFRNIRIRRIESANQ